MARGLARYNRLRRSYDRAWAYVRQLVENDASPYETALNLVERAQLRRAADGDEKGARRDFDQALALAERLGNTKMAERIASNRDGGAGLSGGI